jgi:hypothetical protein
MRAAEPIWQHRNMGLEFIVIGAQKAGTTTLWQLLRDHPQLWLPETKEAPFFSHTEVYERGLRDYLSRLGAPSDGERLRGTVTPHYMHGWHDAGTRTVAERIARALPDVRLIALLRDPVARARSQHAMAIARGREHRSVDEAMSELLGAGALRAARRAPDDSNSYVVQGEYGRVLGEYLGCFPRAALHVELSDALACEPVAVVRRVLGFLGVREDYDPPDPFRRSFAGGRHPRVPDGDLLALLRDIDAAPVSARLALVRGWIARRSLDEVGKEELEGIAQRYIDAPAEQRARERKGFEFTLRKIWNVVPSPPEPISDEVRNALETHYARDAEVLERAIGVLAPWSSLRTA